MWKKLQYLQLGAPNLRKVYMHTFAMKFGFGRGRHSRRHSHGYNGASSLASAPIGSEVRVLHVSGGPEARRKLLDMGILPGESLRIMRNDSDGPLLVQIHGGSVMIGRGLAEKIRVLQE